MFIIYRHPHKPGIQLSRSRFCKEMRISTAPRRMLALLPNRRGFWMHVGVLTRRRFSKRASLKLAGHPFGCPKENQIVRHSELPNPKGLKMKNGNPKNGFVLFWRKIWWHFSISYSWCSLNLILWNVISGFFWILFNLFTSELCDENLDVQM